jgi:AraC-like DNA-binding protein
MSSDSPRPFAALGDDDPRLDGQTGKAHSRVAPVTPADRIEVVASRGLSTAYLPRAGREPGAESGLLVVSADPTLSSDQAIASLDTWSTAVSSRQEPLVVLVDLRPMTSRLEKLGAIMEKADTLRQAFTAGRTTVPIVRLVVLGPSDWTRHFWLGLLSTLPLEGVLSDDPDVAWFKAGVGATERLRLERALRLVHQRPSSTTEHALTELSRRPGHSLCELARALGVSTRSLQRSLAAEGTSFATLREAARFGCARTMLASGEKVTAVAATLGLESTSHFIHWYKRRTGHTPGRGRNTVLFDWSPVDIRVARHDAPQRLEEPNP